jgi:hypothetical protein
VLENAKDKFQLHINTVTPFPTIEHHCSIATALITEAIANFQHNNTNIKFSIGMFCFKPVNG